MMTSILVCIGALVCLLLLLRSNRVSLGLPLAYLYLLIFNHVPGAYAVWAGDAFISESEATAIGIYFTAIASVCFVIGVWLARLKIKATAHPYNVNREQFSKFCLLGGWLFVFGLSPLADRIPSLGAAIEKGGAVWMLGVMLALRSAIQRGDLQRVAIWGTALMVYPTLVLLLGGFLSYGTAAVIIVVAIVAVSTVSTTRVIWVGTIGTFVGVSLFTSYFAHRDEIRQEVWGGAAIERRIDAVSKMFTDFSWLDPTNQSQLKAMHLRLNQNYFVGLAADRISHGEVGYLHGRSIWEGILALVPRAIWPEKPVFGGSPKIVREMTGLNLDENTSWGVGNVMEFHINFGLTGLVIGFLTLGWILGTLDGKAAELERKGDLGRVFFYFLPAVALIQPLGSMVELSGGAAAAIVAAFGWNFAWARWPKRSIPSTKMQRHAAR